MQHLKNQFTKVGITLLLAVIGFFVVSQVVFAAFKSIEPENGSVATPASVMMDASAAGGSAVKFQDASSPTPPPTGNICGTIGMASNGYAGDYTKLGYKGNVTGLQTFQQKYPDSWRTDSNTAEPYQKTGQTFTDFKIGSGRIHPASNNLTFNNFVIDPGADIYPIFVKTETGNIPADGNTFTNGTVAFKNASGSSGYRNYIGGSNTTFRNMDLSGTHDGFSITERVDNITIENVCVHDLGAGEGAHNDGAEIYVGKNITLRNVILDNTVTDESKANSAINFTDEGGDIDNVLLENVTLSTVKGCTIYLRGDGDGNVGNGSFNQTQITNLRFRNVRIARWGTRGGQECRYSYANAVGAIIEWTNVTGPDGQQLPMPQSICTDANGRTISCN